MPVVPRSDRPPTIPRRPFKVLAASASPPGMEISTTASAGVPNWRATWLIARRIISRGTGLMAGSPGGRGRPGLVTVPTPSPARNEMPEPGGPRRTVAFTSAPCVTSGSSPASFTTPAVARSALCSKVAIAMVARAPVVQPRRNGPAGMSPFASCSLLMLRLPDFFPPLPDFPPGEVWLAGAGLGDPRLLTVLALHAVASADDIVHDALVDARVLKLAHPGAELISAGKRGGRPSPQQRDINEVLIERARLGRRVLRLKGGDPFV